MRHASHALRAFLLLALSGLAGCGGFAGRTLTAHECMTRVMYFESNRSSPDGMVAVGTVVMNRVQSGEYPGSVCGVVGQPNQFADGVLSKPMAKGRALAERMATKVLDRGARHERVGRAEFFHTAGMTFPYTNMHYLVVAGGNAFYEKRPNSREIGDPAFVNPEDRKPAPALAGPSRPAEPTMRLIHRRPPLAASGGTRVPMPGERPSAARIGAGFAARSVR